MQCIGAGVYAILDELLDAQIVGRLLALEDFALAPLLLRLDLAIVGQHKVHAPFAIVEASVGL